MADTRMHGTTRRQVGNHLRRGRAGGTCCRCRPEPFPSFREARRTVHRDGHVEVERAYYSVPPEYLARRVWVRWDGRLVRIFNDRMEPIAVHAQARAGRFSTQAPHIATEKISGVERGAAWLLGPDASPRAAEPPLGRGGGRSARASRRSRPASAC